MNPDYDAIEADDLPATPKVAGEDGSTSLPFLRTWPSVYGFVAVVFLIYVVLLSILSRVFA